MAATESIKQRRLFSDRANSQPFTKGTDVLPLELRQFTDQSSHDFLNQVFCFASQAGVTPQPVQDQRTIEHFESLPGSIIGLYSKSFQQADGGGLHGLVETFE